MFLQLEDHGGTPEQQYLEQEAWERTLRLCRRLKEPYQTGAIRHFYEGQTVTEIAADSGKKVQTQVYRAKGMLKKIIKEEQAGCRI